MAKISRFIPAYKEACQTSSDLVLLKNTSKGLSFAFFEWHKKKKKIFVMNNGVFC